MLGQHRNLELQEVILRLIPATRGGCFPTGSASPVTSVVLGWESSSPTAVSCLSVVAAATNTSSGDVRPCDPTIDWSCAELIRLCCTSGGGERAFGPRVDRPDPVGFPAVAAFGEGADAVDPADAAVVGA